jgi:membrane protease YdiL (CAAX protease family)
MSDTTEQPEQPEEMGTAFLDLVNKGETNWKNYGLTFLIIVAFWILGSGTVMIGVYGTSPEGTPFDGTNPYSDFIALNLLFITVLLGLWVGLRRAHKRSLRTLVTPYKNIRWGRILQGFGLQMGLGVIVTIIDAIIFPGTYTYTLDPDRFYKFAILVILLTPFQTTAEELIARSYFLQLLGHFTRHPIALVILNALPFALLHFMNPEIAAHGLVPMMAFYFVVGAFLALVTLKDNGAELALGIHAANNMFAAIFVNYEGSALPTNTVFTAGFVNVWFGLISYIISAAIMYWILFRNQEPLTPFYRSTENQ